MNNNDKEGEKMNLGFKMGGNPLRAAAIAGAMLVVAGCATPFRAQVQHYQAMPAIEGQTFHVAPIDSSNTGSLEFQTYAQVVGEHLQAAGLRPAENMADAQLVVQINYGVGPARERLATSPGSMGMGYGWGNRWYGYSRWGWGWPGWGYYDPFWSQPEVYSYAVYPAFLEMKILRASDKAALFEGRAETTTRTNDLTRNVPKLADALFQNFPGDRVMSGTVKVVEKKAGN